MSCLDLSFPISWSWPTTKLFTFPFLLISVTTICPVSWVAEVIFNSSFLGIPYSSQSFNNSLKWFILINMLPFLSKPLFYCVWSLSIVSPCHYGCRNPLSLVHTRPFKYLLHTSCPQVLQGQGYICLTHVHTYPGASMLSRRTADKQ